MEKTILQEQIKQQELEQQRLEEQIARQKQEQEWERQRQEWQRQEQERQKQELERKLQEQTLAEEERIQGIFDNVNRLFNDYKWKLDLVTEIQERTDALGIHANRGMYIEWVRRNNEAIYSGDALTLYITENRNVLDERGTDSNWASDTLVLIAKNKVTFDRDNQILIGIINKIS